jgi:hypothetical protein
VPHSVPHSLRAESPSLSVIAWQRRNELTPGDILIMRCVESRELLMKREAHTINLRIRSSISSSNCCPGNRKGIVGQ